MNKYNTIFKPTEILLPAMSNDPAFMNRYAVIACDQHTSEPVYWESCRKNVGDALSTYNFVLPEAYLGTSEEEVHSRRIAKSMESFSKTRDSMKSIDGFIYVERTLPDGSVRHGLVGCVDLEKYDYSHGSTSPIRATEATVLERIPPRCKIRSEAVIELPHILILIDGGEIFDELLSERQSFELEKEYDFDLMLGGGHITGYGVCGTALSKIMKKIDDYEKSRSGVIYAMGDGNHSLAAARAHWENVKRDTGNMEHPARYALCEITSIEDSSLVFHPIHRIIKNCDPSDVMKCLDAFADISEIRKNTDKISCGKADCQTFIAIVGEREYFCTFKDPSHALTVGTLQLFIDDYLKKHPTAVCDYIHGEDTVRLLAAEQGNVGFLLDGMDKSELFPYVEKYGILPRKTFSMGEADSKRFYLEARMIVE